MYIGPARSPTAPSYHDEETSTYILLLFFRWHCFGLEFALR